MTAEEWEKKWGSLPQEPQEPLDVKQSAEIKELKVLCARAADALEAWNCAGFYDKLIAELRKAAQ
jgi:hypothetical protein